MESFERRSKIENEPIDYKDAPFYPLFKHIPHELAKRHIAHIEEEGLNDDEATTYLNEIVNQRREAVTTTVISDETAQELLKGHEAEFFKRIETDIFSSPENHIGAGTTARVKQFEIRENDRVIPLAIKYLVSPSAKTLSAAAEHDMVREVERIKHVEEIEQGTPFIHLHVPHPYFHHKNPEVQCYGMELIDGIDLERAFLQIKEGTFNEELAEVFLSIDIDEVMTEIETFFAKMHTYCLHGDIKPKNFMINKKGKFYLIDFGQSILTNDISEKQGDQIEVLKDEEIKMSKYILATYIKAAKEFVART